MSANGRLPASSLATIPGTSRQIRADLVGAVAALRAAFQAHFGRPLTITDGYRPYAEQERIFRQRYTTSYARSAKIDHRTWQGMSWWRLRGYASASTPGQSNHGWGQAIDFGSGVNASLTSPEHRWMLANAPRFGWTHPAWARRSPYLEPWHWEGVPVAGYASNPVGGIGGALPNLNLTPIAGIPEDDMPTMNEFLNTPAFDGGPTISQVLLGMHNVYQGLYSGGPSVAQPAPGSLVDRVVQAPREAWWTTTVERDGQQVPVIQELADAKSLGQVVLTLSQALTQRGTVDVDEKALAAALAPLLRANVTAVSDADLQRIAQAAADETDRRQRERLGR